MSRAELIQICIELKITYKNLSIEEMMQKIKDEFYKKIDKSKKKRIGESLFSKTLLKFATTECDYILKNKDGKIVDYNFKEK